MPNQLSLFSTPNDDQDNAPKSVTEITRYLGYVIDADPLLQDVWIEGEVSNFKRAASGHLYFSMKDEGAQLNCVMWKTAASRLRFEPGHGDQVLAHGRIGLYEPQGAYQLYVDMLQPAGVGDLNRQFELLKEKLAAEGMFDEERKRPLPAYPRCIGIVTSPSTAALQDVLNVFRRRYPSIQLILSPAQVQGEGAPPQIIQAIERLNRRNDVDLIMIVRGGGSLEDLWCFNDEKVVRAVAASRIPTITGVGHEIDFTLVDFASDLRAPTPSAAAEIATPDGEALRYTIKDTKQRLTDILQYRLDDVRQHLADDQRALRLLSPARQIANLRQKLDNQTARLENALKNRVRETRRTLEAQSQRLNAASPQSLLERGYAIVTREGDNQRMNSAMQAAPGTTLRIQMRDGMLKAMVKERKLDSDGK